MNVYCCTFYRRNSLLFVPNIGKDGRRNLPFFWPELFVLIFTTIFVAIFVDKTFALNKATKPPCCMDTLTSVVCQKLKRLSRSVFAKRCNNDIEFRLMQCCTTCNRYRRVVPYDKIAPSLILENCIDRYGTDFCSKYGSDLDVWTLKQWSCDGYSPFLAFRACRKSCGFCDLGTVHYNLGNATSSCKSVEQ